MMFTRAYALLGMTALAYAQETFTNPVLWEDLADIDVIRVDDTFYYSASTMHHSPGAPVLRSYNLADWEYIGHSVPTLDWGSGYSLKDGKRAYVRGIWASTIQYRPSTQTFFWLGCIDSSTTYIYTSSKPEGPWEKSSTIPHCYYDAGLLVDSDDTMYVAYDKYNISVAQLSDDGLSEVKSEVVYRAPDDIGYLEGARFYNINGAHYIWLTRPASDQFVLKSTSGPFGPYELREVIIGVDAPVAGAGSPHQGALVDTPDGDWYYMAFIDAYPGGRIPVLAPVEWDEDGWPSVTLDSGAWGSSYPLPSVSTDKKVSPIPTSYTFEESTLSPEWEWNHNPDNSKWSSGNGLTLQAATVTDDLYSARNTLTRRIPGPKSSATIRLDISSMADGDRAGLSLFRDSSAWIGVRRDNGSSRVSMTNGLTMDANWNTKSKGSEEAGAEIAGDEIWLRAIIDITPGTGRKGSFAYSTDGSSFIDLGGELTLNSDWPFFLGYRYGIFNYATKELGGEVRVKKFELGSE